MFLGAFVGQIRYKALMADDLAVVYMEKGEFGGTATLLPVTKDGDFSRPWPNGFFEERLQELF